jgi:phosphatidylglycerophosphate synthase
MTAIWTDLLDGWLARRLGAPTQLGLWLDPFADKFLTDTTWIALWYVDFAPGWLVFPTLIRDVLVIVIWLYSKYKGHTWKASGTGQTGVAYEGTALCVLVFHDPWLDVSWPSVGVVLGIIALVLSFISITQHLTKGPRRA